MTMVLVETNEVFEPGDSLGKSIAEGHAVVMPDIFDVLEDLLFHDGHRD